MEVKRWVVVEVVSGQRQQEAHARTHSLTHSHPPTTLSGSSGSEPGCCRSKRPELPADCAWHSRLLRRFHPPPISRFLACDQHMMVMTMLMLTMNMNDSLTTPTAMTSPSFYYSIDARSSSQAISMCDDL